MYNRYHRGQFECSRTDPAYKQVHFRKFQNKTFFYNCHSVSVVLYSLPPHLKINTFLPDLKINNFWLQIFSLKLTDVLLIGDANKDKRIPYICSVLH